MLAVVAVKRRLDIDPVADGAEELAQDLVAQPLLSRLRRVVAARQLARSAAGVDELRRARVVELTGEHPAPLVIHGITLSRSL